VSRPRSFCLLVSTLAALALGVPAGTWASEGAHPVEGRGLAGWNDFFLKRTKPIQFQRGLGNIGMRVTTDSALAQSWFDQGLAQLFGFAHEDAIYSFENALRADPNLAMAWWGIAWAFGENINLLADAERAREAERAAAKAKALMGPASEREQAYIRAIQGRYQEGFEPLGSKDRAPLDREFFLRMEHVRRTFSNDLHAATLAAEAGLDLHPWDQWSKDGKARPETLLIVGVLKDVLERDPHHVGAQHYLIHAVEASPDPDEAALAAWRIKSDAWGQPHLVHAASHIYARDGDWGAAMISGEDAEHEDALYLEQNGRHNLYTLAHGSHNIHFEASVMSMGGRERLAVANAKQLRLRVEPYLDDLRGLEYYQFYEILMRTRFGEWQRVLDMPPPQHAYLLGARAMRHYARGVAFAKLGQLGQAEDERRALAALRDQLRLTPKYPKFNLNPAVDVVNVALAVLEARMEWARGDRRQAVDRFRDAVRLETGLHYDEPPPWYFPSGEALGAALIVMGRYDEAEAAFLAVLKEFPDDGRALFGLAESLRRRGAPTTVVAPVERSFSRAWRWADRPLTLNDLL
jgi:tetratricopeptide (TPR) repeat protein